MKSFREFITESQQQSDVHKLFAKVAKKYEKNQVADSSHPAGPDTSKFRASSSGKITHEQNVVTHRGPGGMFRDVHQHFLKIGTGVDNDTRKKIIKDIHDGLSKIGHKTVNHKNEEVDHMPGPHDSKVGLGHHDSQWFNTKNSADHIYHVSRVSGSNWGGIGISRTK